MKKQELIHYHALLCELRTNIEHETHTTLDIPEYEEVGVGPVSIHASKGKHEDAVFALADGIAAHEAEVTASAATAAPPADD